MEIPTPNREMRFAGLPISGGIAVARVCLFNENRHNTQAVEKVTGEGVAHETERVRQAIRVAIEQLDELAKDVADRIGAAEAQIFVAQKMITGDRVLVGQIIQSVETLDLSAEAAIVRTLDVYETRLLDVDNDYIRERASDIGEIRRRLLGVLGNMDPAFQCFNEEHCRRGRNRVVVAEELTAGATVGLDSDRALGFVTERGGPTSHAAILARALGIPAVSGIAGIHRILSCGTELLLDGNTGLVVAWPSDDTLAEAQSRQMATASSAIAVEPVPELTVLANISRAADVDGAVSQKAEGIGLYRTEFEFLTEGRALDEDEQFERYSSVVKAMEGRPTTFRLLDIGGEKAAPFLKLPKEDNPALGLRGSRLLLKRSDLLEPQARALARASQYGTIDVLYPMIVDVDQFVRLKEHFCEAAAGLPIDRLRHGVMFEVPSACLQARELLEVADFGSIGTNDLVQYLFAVERNNDLVTYDYTVDSSIFWSVLEAISSAAARTGKTVSVCGEAASNAEFLPKLMELGLTTLSVSPRFIPILRTAVREFELNERAASGPTASPSTADTGPSDA